MLKQSELASMTIREIAADIRDRRCTPTDLVRVLLERIRKTEKRIKAYVTVRDERELLREASQVEIQIKQGLHLGPLHGIPVSVKDIFDTEGIKTTYGSKLMTNHIPNSDSAVVERLKAAGAIILGKLNTHEFAVGCVTPPTKNPWNVSRIPGGSSGGSAAAVAVSSAIAATGSDTGGSIRIPASLCGVVGLKPTYERVSRAGLFPLSWSLDHAGPITRRVEDAALLLEIMIGNDFRDPTSGQRLLANHLESSGSGVSGLTVGIPRDYFFERCESAVERAVRSGIDVLESLGCKALQFDFPQIPEIMAADSIIETCEASAIHLQTLLKSSEHLSEDVRLYLQRGLFIPATYYIKSQLLRAQILRGTRRLFEEFDVMITPTVPTVAPPVGRECVSIQGQSEELADAMVRYTAPFNFIGLPALSVPCGFDDGLPIGMQIIGDINAESTVLKVGQAYEKSTNWHDQLPRIS